MEELLIKNKKGLAPTMHGFIIGLVLITLLAFSFSYFFSALTENYNVTGDNIFNSYNLSSNLSSQIGSARDDTEIEQSTDIVDIIGGFFSSGYSALKTSLKSFAIFEQITNEAASDVPEIADYKGFIITILLALILFGIVISALLKWRV